MTDALIIDLLLGAVVLLSMPLGFWRGVAREAFVSAGILLGMALADAWAERWGRHAADWFSLGEATGRFVAAVSLVLVSMLVLGYGGAALGAGQAVPGLFGRMAGAAVAAANAAILLAWALFAIARDVADARAVDVMNEAFLAGRLLRNGDRVLLAIAGAAAAFVIIGSTVAVTGRGRSLPQSDAAMPPGRAMSSAERLRPVRFARDTDAGKFEPESRQFDARTGRYGADAPAFSTSMPLTNVDQARWARDTRAADPIPTWGRRRDGDAAPRNGRFGGREWLRRSQPDAQPADGSVPRRQWQRQQTSAVARCSACGSPMTVSDAFCPTCGTAVSR